MAGSPRVSRLARRWHPSPLPRRTVRLRLTLVYGGLFLASGVALLALTYFLVKQDIRSNFVPTTNNGAAAIIAGKRADVRFANVVVNPGLFEAGFSVSVHAHHSVGGQTGGLMTVGKAQPGNVVIQLPVPLAGGKVPSPKQAQEQLTILSSEVIAEQNTELHQLLLDSGIALLIMAALSILLGWLVAGRALRPLRLITAKARDISASNLHERIALQGPDDEMKRLGDTFDDLLVRLERAFEAQRQFVANASHELRTPLARQRTLLEVAASDPDADPASLREASAKAISAGEEQERLIESLLTLASSERGLDERGAFDLADVARQVVEARRAEAEQRGLSVDSALSSAPTAGNPRLAERLVANLVDNALRYNEPQGWIRVTTGVEAGFRRDGEAGGGGDVGGDGDGAGGGEGGGAAVPGKDEDDLRAVLRVANRGPQVPPSEIPRLFEPFQRLESSRTARDGNGLGLSIVRAVATAHGATVTVTSRPEGGLDVRVAFAPERNDGYAASGDAVDAASPLRETESQ
jgi:signal transduction histidine kinase